MTDRILDFIHGKGPFASALGGKAPPRSNWNHEASLEGDEVHLEVGFDSAPMIWDCEPQSVVDAPEDTPLRAMHDGRWYWVWVGQVVVNGLSFTGLHMVPAVPPAEDIGGDPNG